MADVFDRPLFNNTAARDRLKKMGNIQDYAGTGMFGTGGTMEDTGFRYQQPLGYGEGQVDPSIPEAIKQRALSGSQIVRGGRYSQKDVRGLVGQFQQARNDLLQQLKDAQLSSDPNKFEVIKDLEGKITSLDQMRDQTLEEAGKVTYTAQDKYGQLGDAPTAIPVRDDPMLPQNVDIFQSLSERAAQNNLKAVPPVPNSALKRPPSDMEADARGQYRAFVDGKPMTAADLPAFKGRLENQAGPSGMEADARKTQMGSGSVPLAAGQTTMEADARGRKPMAITPADVAAGLNDPKPEVREKTAADFAKQFTDMGPKYEGIDKGLLLAQIGFAIAAGESPNAMKNIADGLSLGADTAIKDKAAKAEFDRQIQLSAMQYGLESYAADQQRLKQPLKFVALEDTVYNGKKVPAGTAVHIPYGVIEKNGGVVPPGFGDSEMVDALLTKKSGMLDLIQKTYEQGLVDDTFLAAETEKYSEAASIAISSQRALDYIDSAMLQVGEGGVTGLKPAAKSLLGKAAAAVGLSEAAEYTDRDEFVATMKLAFQEMMPASLSGVQSANSISNLDVTMMAEAFADAALKDGVFSMAFVSDNTLLNQLKAASNKMQAARQQALATMGGVEQGLSGRYLRSGSIDSPVAATTALDPYRSLLSGPETSSSNTAFGNLVLGENGVYDIIFPEG